MANDDDTSYHWAMQPDRTYVSKAFLRTTPDSNSPLLRFATRVIDSEGLHVCDVDGQELVIRKTDKDRQQIKALFFEDDRSIETLIFQRFTTSSKKPLKQSFSFSGEEIDRIRWLLEFVRSAEFDDSNKVRFADDHLQELLSEDAELLRFVRANRERLGRLERAGDLARYLEFCERKRQLDVFESLLNNDDFFQQMAREWQMRGPEAVWQDFFERNAWIFGLSLAPVFLSSLESRKLEQVVRGYSVAGEGKRVDALMRTNGILSSLCFVEIKTHSTDLLRKEQYRRGVWGVSDEVSGAVAQCHVTVQAAIKELQTKLELHDENGNPMGMETYLYRPRSYLVVGCLDEFVTETGTNEAKFRSFELFRRNIRTPEIVTFDELYERAKATVDGSPIVT